MRTPGEISEKNFLKREYKLKGSADIDFKHLESLVYVRKGQG